MDVLLARECPDSVRRMLGKVQVRGLGVREIFCA
jgi:hypothetical protein